jgi:hypothetical protein
LIADAREIMAAFGCGLNKSADKVADLAKDAKGRLAGLS